MHSSAAAGKPSTRHCRGPGAYLQTRATDGSLPAQTPLEAPTPLAATMAGPIGGRVTYPNGDGLAVGDPSPDASSPPTAVEQEIVRLTNELRADPSGPLARHKPLPDCVHDHFYGISLGVTGAPRPVGPLVFNESISIQMARMWAAELEQSGVFRHRSAASEQRLYRQLHQPVSAWGENISWLSGFDPALTARTHFEGWRESDTGHYCALVTGRFSHVGGRPSGPTPTAPPRAGAMHDSDSTSWAGRSRTAPALRATECPCDTSHASSAGLDRHDQGSDGGHCSSITSASDRH